MPGTPVTPVNFTTARQDLAAGLYALLQAIQAANPTQLRQVWPSRPGSFPETPAMFIGNLDETLINAGSTKQRTFLAEIVTVDKLIDNTLTGNRIDALVDLLRAWVQANVQAIVTDANGVHTTALDPLAQNDGELDVAGNDLVVHYASSTLTIRAIFQEGGSL